MWFKLRDFVLGVWVVLASACNPSFTPDWSPMLDLPEAGEPDMDGGEELDAGNELDAALDAGAEAGHELEDADLGPSDVTITPVIDCEIFDPCDGGDASCARVCYAPCADIPCVPGTCVMSRTCSLPCTWCRGLTPPIK